MGNDRTNEMNSTALGQDFQGESKCVENEDSLGVTMERKRYELDLTFMLNDKAIAVQDCLGSLASVSLPNIVVATPLEDQRTTTPTRNQNSNRLPTTNNSHAQLISPTRDLIGAPSFDSNDETGENVDSLATGPTDSNLQMVDHGAAVDDEMAKTEIDHPSVISTVWGKSIVTNEEVEPEVLGPLLEREQKAMLSKEEANDLKQQESALNEDQLVDQMLTEMNPNELSELDEISTDVTLPLADTFQVEDMYCSGNEAKEFYMNLFQSRKPRFRSVVKKRLVNSIRIVMRQRKATFYRVDDLFNTPMKVDEIKSLIEEALWGESL
ncbi:MAG: hypothetical protein SGILL_001343 [Bacillariaceae sp.]